MVFSVVLLSSPLCPTEKAAPFPELSALVSSHSQQRLLLWDADFTDRLQWFDLLLAAPSFPRAGKAVGSYCRISWAGSLSLLSVNRIKRLMLRDLHV